MRITDAKQRTTIRPANSSGHLGATPVPVAGNSAGAIEIGAYTRTRSGGLAFTVTLVEKAANGRALSEDDFRLATIDESLAVKDRRAQVTLVMFGTLEWATTLDVHQPRAQRESTLNIETPYATGGVGGLRERMNGDRLVQHGVVLVDPPAAVAELQRREELVGDLYASARLQDRLRAGQVAETLLPVSSTIEIGVEWPAVGLHALTAVRYDYEPDPVLSTPPNLRAYEVNLER